MRKKASAGSAIRPADEHGLVVTNQLVVAAAKQLRMRPVVLVQRVAEFLPAPVEQHFYLKVASELAIRPATFARILRAFLGPQPLTIHDLASRTVGAHLVVNKFDAAAEFVAGVLRLCVPALQSDFTISFDTACKLMLEYATIENAEIMIDSIVAEIEEVRHLLGYRHMSDRRAIACAIDHLVNDMIPALRRMGKPLPNSFTEAFRQGYNAYVPPRRRASR